MTTTMSLIAKQTVGSGGASSVTFSNIPQTFTDLKLVMSAKGSASGTRQNVLIQLNGSGSNFTWLGLYGYNTSVGSNTTSNNFAGNVPNAGNTASSFSTQEIYIPNYTSTTTAKSLSIDYAVENNGTDNFMGFDADLWNPGTQAAITSITLSINSSGDFIENSTFYLYGISNSTTTQASTVPYASGGDVITTDGTYWYHAFKYSGSFKPLKNLSADILVVAGGGASGRNASGGGGAGGLRGLTTQSLNSGTLYTATIGAGGTGGINDFPPACDGTNGVNSSFAGSGLTTITASGGGGSAGAYGGGTYNAGKAGGSGAGGLGNGNTPTTAGAGNAGSYSPVEGYAGGAGSGSSAGGGGGAAEVGNTDGQGSGGDGSSAYSSWGSATNTGQLVSSTYFYAGGGSGYAGSGTITGGDGGGGTGQNAANGTNGTANTGGGAGGAGGGAYTGGNGGSGIIIVRYAV